MKDEGQGVDATQATAAASPSAKQNAGLPRGATVGRYVILDGLGSGGMGVVYKAHDPELDRTIALKLLRTHADGMRERLLREAKALARLSHPNVIAIHDVGVFQDEVFLAMEFVAGQTLRRWLRAALRPQAEIVRVFTAAGEGLAAAHRAGLIHRDFKPDNVIVGDDGRVAVLDFGLARAAGERSLDSTPSPTGEITPVIGQLRRSGTDISATSASAAPTRELVGSLSSRSDLSAELTEVGAVMGTPGYMAPEQHRGEAASPATDQWSFCVAFYEALYGERPFAGKNHELREAVLGGRMRAPPADARVPKRLRNLLLRGLALDPDARFPHMAALLAALHRESALGRRGWMLAAGAVLTAGVVAVAVGRPAAKAPEVCGGAAAKLAGVWDAEREKAVQAAFLATGVPYRQDAFRGAKARLDDYARGWLAMHTASCKATRVVGDQSEELLDLRTRCLMQRLDELGAKVDLFAHADAPVVEKAVASLAALTPLDGCADAEALRARVPLPRAVEARARVDELRHEVALAKADAGAGRYEAGRVRAEAAVAGARALGYRPLEAEAAHTLGVLLTNVGDYAGAERVLREAWAAAIAGRDDEQLILSTAWLVSVVGDYLGRHADGEDIARLAEASIERLGKERVDLSWPLLRARGNVAYRRGQYAEALALHQRALALLEKSLPGSPSITVALSSVAEDLRALARYGEAETEFRRVLDIRLEQLGPAHPQVGQTLGSLANVLADRGQHLEAIAHYERSLSVLRGSLGADHPWIASNLNNLADEQRLLGRYDEAIANLEEAARLWERRLGKEHSQVAYAHFNLGQIHLANHRYDQALTRFEAALAIRERAIGVDHPDYALTLSARGDTRRELGRVDAALADQRRALVVVEKALGADHPSLVDVLLGLGRSQLAAGSPAQAVPLFERALRIAAAHPGDATTLADVRFELGRAMWRRGADRERAVGLAHEARTAWAAAGDRGKAPVATIDAWLRAPR